MFPGDAKVTVSSSDRNDDAAGLDCFSIDRDFQRTGGEID